MYPKLMVAMLGDKIGDYQQRLSYYDRYGWDRLALMDDKWEVFIKAFRKFNPDAKVKQGTNYGKCDTVTVQPDYTGRLRL